MSRTSQEGTRNTVVAAQERLPMPSKKQLHAPRGLEAWSLECKGRIDGSHTCCREKFVNWSDCPMHVTECAIADIGARSFISTLENGLSNV